MVPIRQNEKIRNIAIIAHVDHGKTTLVDAMFKQAGLFREGASVQDRLMDNQDLEKERGITISAKNCEVEWKGVKINILDTPGHADFGGEVERALSMVDGVILLVDASEGPLPQTRFVLDKALKLGLHLTVVINKIDRGDARPLVVFDEVNDLLIDLDATDEQLEFPLIYAIGRDGIAKKDLDDEASNLDVLFDTIINEIPGPTHNINTPFQMLVCDLSYSDFLGRLAIGKIHNGSVTAKDKLVCIDKNGDRTPLKVSKLQVHKGVGYEEVETAEPGDIVILSGVSDVSIGDTICAENAPEPLPRLEVEEPTVSMRFTINTSPLVGQEGKIVQGSKLQARLEKETLNNVAIQVVPAEDGDGWIVKGRGELQMAIIIEEMRREGFELCVGRPEVICHKKDGKLMEPMEHLSIDCEEIHSGVIIEKISKRKGIMSNFMTEHGGRCKIDFLVPSRALIGYRDEFLTDTKGSGIMNSISAGFEEYKGAIPSRLTGSLVADRPGSAVPYALFHLEPRGTLYIEAGAPIYEGMIIGVRNKEHDLNVNPCKAKQLSNVRASGKDDAVVLTPVSPMSLERAINIILEDEMVEITPKSIRLRKKILSAQGRKGAKKREN
ncbi:translational GTPase TypA [Thiospirochaeta perfilievii]|uniref:Large ribosomal subunit assembly factor BipA n=1 Tax=Thiospirochaeta perfilievii TaxID=252967 RepID=A0A5C1QII9_9SPIO|nr:translational GTPase TypA [Thiospirochaeta perfilievii]QEN06296.1 translational GTPase TypA [Thiospirochaeta perfilievii]